MHSKFSTLFLAFVMVVVGATVTLAASKTFNENGTIQSETFYNPQTKQKEKTNWYDQNGVLKSQEQIVDAQTRVVTFYNEMGQKNTEETLVDGKRTKVRAFYPSGGVEREYGLKDEKIEGKFNVYFENGKLKQESEYKDGVEL